MFADRLPKRARDSPIRKPNIHSLRLVHPLAPWAAVQPDQRPALNRTRDVTGRMSWKGGGKPKLASTRKQIFGWLPFGAAETSRWPLRCPENNRIGEITVTGYRVGGHRRSEGLHWSASAAPRIPRFWWRGCASGVARKLWRGHRRLRGLCLDLASASVRLLAGNHSRSPAPTDRLCVEKRRRRQA